MILWYNKENIISAVIEVMIMTNTGAKAAVSVRIDAYVKELPPTIDERILDLFKKKNLPVVDIGTDENGHMFVDKDKHPRHYDWAVNG